MKSEHQLQLDQALEGIWWLAKSICDETCSFEPDLVIGLAHGGRLPLHAAQVLWRETHAEPIPATLALNLGREKKARYCQLCEILDLPPLDGEYSNDIIIGHFLSWIARQHRWQDELREQVASVLGPGVAPLRVLVCDEFIHYGDTWILALGLLRSTYPVAQTRLVAGHCQWRYDLGRVWLEGHHPGVYPQIEAEHTALCKKEPWGGVLRYLDQIALGSEDVDPESLAWQPIDANSVVVQRLREYLSPEEWLALPRWVETVVEAHMRTRAHEVGPAEEEPACPAESRTLHPEYLICQHVCEHGRISLQEATSICKLPQKQVVQHLQWLVEYNQLHKKGGSYKRVPQPPFSSTCPPWLQPA